MAQRSAHEIDMLHGPILPKYFAFTIPMALSMMLQLLFNAADVIVVGRFAGANALAAVGSTTALVSLMINFISGISSGVNIIIAREYAIGDFDDVSETVHTAIPIGFLGGLLFAAGGIAFAMPILTLMKSPEGVIGMSATYLRIYFLCMPAVAVYNFGAAILRSIGDTKRPMYYLIGSGVINVILNLYTVIVLGWSVRGVAIATAVSNLVSALLVVRALILEESCLKLSLKKLKLRAGVVKQIFRLGLPTAVQGSVYAISNVLIQSSVNSFGPVYMAGNAAAQSLEGFQFAFLVTNLNTTLTFMSQHYGARMYKRAKKVFRTVILAGMAIATLIGLLFMIFRVPLLSIYNPDPEVISVGARRMSIVVMVGFLEIIMDAYSSAIRAAGHTMEPTIVSLLFACLFRALWLATVFRMFHVYEVIVLVWPISWILTILCYIPLFKHVTKGLPTTDADSPVTVDA